MWSYLNAFLGSAQYGELALQYDVALRHLRPCPLPQADPHQHTEFICNCLNYSDQWIKTIRPKRLPM